MTDSHFSPVDVDDTLDWELPWSDEVTPAYLTHAVHQEFRIRSSEDSSGNVLCSSGEVHRHIGESYALDHAAVPFERFAEECSEAVLGLSASAADQIEAALVDVDHLCSPSKGKRHGRTVRSPQSCPPEYFLAAPGAPLTRFPSDRHPPAHSRHR